MEIDEMLQMEGVPYPRSYDIALDIRTDEMLSGDIVSDLALFQIAADECEEMGIL
jgi:hypothetical protein